MSYLETAQQLVTTQGKQRPKKLHAMLKVYCPNLNDANFLTFTFLCQGLSLKHLGPYEEGTEKGSEKTAQLKMVALEDLEPGLNKEKVVLGKVVSGLHSEDSVAL